MKLCLRHHTLEVKRTRRRLLEELWGDVLHVLWDAMIPSNQFIEYIAGRLTIIDATPEEHAQIIGRAQDEIDFYNRIHNNVPNLDPPRSDLEAFTRDRQNVHTQIAAQHTNEALNLLLATPVVPDDTSPLSHIQWAWCEMQRIPSDLKTFNAVLKDTTRWYRAPFCRSENDWLYKRTLDGLWMHIKDSPMKEELLKRLWEEAYDSLRMCCEGHISRLCNVLVGFDEAFKSPVSVGELLQQRISAIAEKDIPIPHKVGEAWAVFEELQVPRDKRMGWIEAF